MGDYISSNPFTEERLAKFDLLSEDELNKKIEISATAFRRWRNTSHPERKQLLQHLSERLVANKSQYAKTITLEMGKPIKQSLAEIKKCALLCRHFAENAEGYLKPEGIQSEHAESNIHFEPLGVVFGIMPWNFPFWQVIRCAVPTIAAGNTFLLKHSENVPQCAKAIEDLFLAAGFPQGVFNNLFVSHDQAAKIIEHPAIQGISLTGSEKAGSIVTAQAGKNLKKVVLELGGSDPVIVFSDADMEKAVNTVVLSRFQNNGQSCIAAKRVIVAERIAPEFLELLIRKFEELQLGDPLLSGTDVGPLARKDLVTQLSLQVKATVDAGAKSYIYKGKVPGKGYFYPPTLLYDIPKEAVSRKEELFGPVLSVLTFKTEPEAVDLANETRFGLGAAVWTNDLVKARRIAFEIEAGCVFINALVKSEPGLPFGGIKKSGYGREMGEWGIREFTNIKTICIH
ncbi:MAG: NAD-dependent succinate-semialdehyde dehydrogenase [Bacteroidota bacterium]|nr:NAD-dependent succinate-semialdehyde dehydrogenase [Bacteroidota bacterium]